jgi:Zn-dependent M28 family amino/carboxypeptidase
MDRPTMRRERRHRRRSAPRTAALLATALLVAALAPAAAAAPNANAAKGQATAAAAPGQPPAAAGQRTPPQVPSRNACDNRNNNTYAKLLECISVDGAMVHQRRFQTIADANDDTRVSGTPGFDRSAEYVADQMRLAGYDVTVQEFDFPFFVELSDPTLQRLAPPPAVTYAYEDDFASMTYSGSGDVTATATALPAPPADDTPGCEATDFAGFPSGTIALISRGACTFQQKAENAEAAGAAGVIIYNNAPGAFFGTLGAPTVTIPVVGAAPELGTELAGATVRLRTDTLSETRSTVNVFAETRAGRDDNVVMVGAHLDSVYQGPGINDNGSGSSALLEVAWKMRKVDVENKVRFAWWGAEEFGLLGSDHYVYTLPDDEREDIALYLNFDMVASPNYVRFIYDGDGSAFGLAGPQGSAQIESLYEDFYASRNLAWEPTEISFRSDYAAFFDFGIPFGGLFTGAEGIKTPEEQAIYGGTVGEQYDACYHLACDTIDNLDLEVFDLNIDAIGFTTLTYAFSTETVNGVPGRRVPGYPSPVFGSRVNAPPGAGTHTHSGGGGLHPERDPNHDHHDHHHHPYHDED